MKVTRDVVMDLLPLYESGDASADTQVLIDEFMKTDPEFRHLVLAMRTKREALPAVSTAPGVDVEREAVTRTRKALRRKSWTLGLAIFFTLMPFWFVQISGQPTFFMWRDEPGSRLFLLAAAWLWFSYYRQSRAMRPSGW